MINLKTSDNYKNNDLNNILLLNNENLNEFILNIGVFVLKNINNTHEYPIFEDNDKKCSSFIETINNLQKKIEIMDKQNYLNIQNIIQNYKNKNEINDNNSFINEKISCIDNKFQLFFDRFFKGNIEKGNFGENFVGDYLKDKFFNSNVTDTHKETSFGDLFFEYNDMKTLIECKNVKNLKKDDFNKFYNDIELRSNNNEINSALFVSLTNSNLVNNSKYFLIEYKFNIPILYISDIFNNPEFIRFSIINLESILKNLKNKTCSSQLDEFLSNLDIVSNLIVSHFEYINSDRKLISKLQININNREKDLNNINSKILKIIDKKSSDDESTDYIKKIYETINNNKNFKINLKNLNSIGISKNILLDLGGIKDLIIKVKDLRKISL